LTFTVRRFSHVLTTERLAALTGAAPNLPDRLPADWYRRKIAQVQKEMAKRNLDALVLMRAVNVIYTTGYFHLSTERPLAALIPKSGEPTLFIPALESDQVKLWWVRDYESYFDYPGPVSRVRWIFERVASRGFAKSRIGVEEATPSRMHQIELGAPDAEMVEAGDLVEEMRHVGRMNQHHAPRYVFNDFSTGRPRLRATHGAVSETKLKSCRRRTRRQMAAELKTSSA
jgi:hypothetical protein